jgi:Uncharacterized protein conserved in bacteria
MARRGEHSREEIRGMALAAAERIVAQQGYTGLSARKIAAEIGYTVGSLYLVFRNLDDLILHINVRTLDQLSSTLDQAIATCAQPEACLIALGRAYIRFASEQRHRWRLIFEHRLPEDEALPAWYKDQVMGLFDKVERQLSFLAPQHSRQEIGLAARALWGGVHGICVLALTGKLDVVGVQSVVGLAESLIKNYLAGFIAGANPGAHL